MAIDAEDSPDLDVQEFRLWWEHNPPLRANAGRPRPTKGIATGLALAGLAAIAVLALRNPPKEPPVAAAVEHAPGQSPRVGSGTPSRDVPAVSTENLPSLQVAKESPGAPPPASSISPPVAGAPPNEAVVATAPPTEAPDTAPGPLRKRGAPIGKPISPDSAVSAGEPKPAAAPERAASNGAPATDRVAKSDSATKPPPTKAPSRVVAASKDAAEAGEAPLPEAPVRPAGATPESAPPQAEADTLPASFNRMLHVFGGLFGAKSPPASPLDLAPAPAGWAVQLAAPKTETEARSDLRRFNARYASALKGSKIAVRKAVVDGVTVYRVRVGDLSRADAATLCARLKDDGGSCFLTH